jgi:pimeloyl-ACP methyl ester carboxylesterase
VTDTVVSTDGTRIVCHRQGDGPPLLIVHGTLATTDMYRPIADLLSPWYQVVLMERRDYGVSGSGPRPGSLARQAEDVVAVLGALDGPSYLFGHSFGGLAALQATTVAGHAVRRLALYEPPVALAGKALGPVLDRCRELVDAGHDADAVLHFLTATGGSPPGSGAALRRIGDLLGYRAGGMLADLECVVRMDPDLGRWSAIDAPTLLLTGTESDRYGRQSTELLREILRYPHPVSLPGQAHHPDDPALVAGTLREFFGRSN